MNIFLEIDPIRNGVDDRYVIVHPHEKNVEVIINIYRYKFLERVIKIYLNNRVDLTPHITIKEGLI